MAREIGTKSQRKKTSAETPFAKVLRASRVEEEVVVVPEASLFFEAD